MVIEVALEGLAKPRVRNRRGPRLTLHEHGGTPSLSFREKKDWELNGLSDEDLIAYVIAARRAGNGRAAKLGLGIFAYRKWDLLVWRAKKELPDGADVEDLVGKVIEGVFKAAFRGEHFGEAVSLLNRVFRNKIADFYRREEPYIDQLPEDSEDADHWRPDAATVGDRTGEYEVQEIARARYDALAPRHRMVVDLFVLDSYDANETAEQVNLAFPGLDRPMSDQNVHQIGSRFRRDLRGDLESF
jgi:RNA polymerase sigma factor (sigma-70 family)